ncbi:MAG: sigma-70 family RNA polymerase sigma factor [Planctomycetota bacterium]|nr:sigma-70 family RNA polymerase sigma factor [Planctomycetota bacterium]
MSNSSNNDSSPDSDQARLEALLEAHLPGLRGFLRNRAAEFVLAKESVDDLTQSACRETVKHLREGRFELRSDSEFKQWLYQAGLLKLKSRARFHSAGRRDFRREARPVHPVDSSDPGFDPLSSATPSRFAATNEARERVRQCIASLGGRDEQILTLAVLEGRPHHELATILEVEEAHSRMILSRAMAKLAKRLQG